MNANVSKMVKYVDVTKLKSHNYDSVDPISPIIAFLLDTITLVQKITPRGDLNIANLHTKFEANRCKSYTRIVVSEGPI